MTIEAFAKEAGEFCRWIEAGDFSNPAAVATALHRLAAIYSTFFNLGGYVDPEPNAPEPHTARDKRERAFERLGELPFDLYGSVGDPHQVPPTDSIELGDIRDDLADIYGDIVAGLDLFANGFPLAARSHWVLLFFHWGEHATQAMVALHSWLQEKRIVGIPER